ncbi:MAG: DUF4328 domain-containing protein [Alphaproteobacteria bacterium]|nr:DUF4328 domain-containing protein [Alphaproteobacteria bacterium]
MAAALVFATAASGYFIHRFVNLVEEFGFGEVPIELIDALPDSEVVALLTSLCGVASGVLFLVEMKRAHAAIAKHRPGMLQRYWITVVTLAVPLANFYWPWKGFAEIHRGVLSPAREDKPPKVATTVWLAISFYVTLLVERIVENMFDKVPDTIADAEAFGRAFEPIANAVFVSAGFTAVSAVLAFSYLNAVSVARRDGVPDPTIVDRFD